MREIVRAWLVKNETAISSVRVCMRDGKRLVTVARLAAKDRDPKVADDDGKATVEWVDEWPDLEAAIVTAIEEASEEGAFDGFRLFGYDETGRQTKTKVGPVAKKKHDDKDDDQGDDDAGTLRALSYMGGAVRDLAFECRMMLREARNTIGTLTDTLTKREEVMGAAVGQMIEAKTNEMAAEARAFEAGAVMESLVSEMNNEESAAPEMAVGLLGELLGKLGLKKQPNLSDLADRYVRDPKVRDKVNAELLKAKERADAAAAAATNGASEPEATP